MTALSQQLYSDTLKLHTEGTLEGQRQEEGKSTDSDNESVIIRVDENFTPREYTYTKDPFSGKPATYEDYMCKDNGCEDISCTGSIGVLNVVYGNTYIISDATCLEKVNLLMPEDYTYLNTGGLAQTTISFEGETLVVKDLIIEDGTTQAHSIFPDTYINGTHMSVTAGQDGEYSEIGNKLIWNFPKLKTGRYNGTFVTSDQDGANKDNRLSLKSGQNIPGHILAPYAEIWHYNGEENSTPYWLGGNINGGIIAKSIHIGIMEMHMWPYKGDDSVSVKMGVNKTFSTELKDWLTESGENRDFTFVLDLGYLDNGDVQDPDGINTRVPQEVTLNNEGAINFPYIYFGSAGTYRFQIYEKIPIEGDADYDPNMKYDKSLYMLEVVIEEEENKNDSSADNSIGGELVIKSQVLYQCRNAEGDFLGNLSNGLHSFPVISNNEMAEFTNGRYEEGQTHVNLIGTKTYTETDVALAAFRFTVDLDRDIYAEGVSSVDGMMGHGDGTSLKYPLIAHAEADGSIKFPTFEFDKEGTYNFTIVETPRDLNVADDEYDNIFYDNSIYKVEIVVTSDLSTGANVLTSTTTITKTQDTYGFPIEPPENIAVLGGILFENSTKLPIMPRTGGVGVYVLYVMGGALLALSGAMIYTNKRKDEDS